MTMIDFVIMGEPVAKARARTVTKDRNGNVLPFARTYTPKKTADAEYDFKLQSLYYKPIEPFACAISLELKIYRSMPKSLSKHNQELAEAGIFRPVTKPDNSNYCKLCEDAMNGIFWKDDSQVVDLFVYKFYSKNPRIEVHLKTL